jgi:hypothetical protein
MPHKNWAPNEAVYSADFNPDVADQVVATFPDAATRSAQWALPPTGAVSTLLDTAGVLWQWNGTAWIPITGTRYAARVRANAWTMPAASLYQIPFDTVDYDYNANMTLGATARYTAPVAGLYDVRSSVGWNFNGAAGMNRIWLYKNGAQFSGGVDVQMASGGGIGYHLMLADTVLLALNDTLDIRVAQSSGNAVAGTTDTFFAVRRV